MKMTDEQRRAAEIARTLIATPEERQEVLATIRERRAVLLAERAAIDEELASMEAIEAGHRAALAH